MRLQVMAHVKLSPDLNVSAGEIIIGNGGRAETDAAGSPYEINTRIGGGDTANMEGHGQDGYVVVMRWTRKDIRDDGRDRLIITYETHMTDEWELSTRAVGVGSAITESEVKKTIETSNSARCGAAWIVRTSSP